jgi:hypothetical protein
MSQPETAVTLVLPDLLQGQWSSAVIATYNADLGFFHAKLARQLAQVPLRMVLADGELLTMRLREAATTGQHLRMINRSYLVSPIRHTKAAHAKLILLLAQGEGLLAVGSGNLGHDGYASPGELWHVFRYQDERPQHLAEFASVRALIDGLATRHMLDPAAVELLQITWGTASWLPDTSPAPMATVRHNLDRPLLDQLAEVVDWPVRELVAYAPFHDPDCLALSTLIERFSPERATVLVRKDTSVDPRQLTSVLASAKRGGIEVLEVAAEPGTYIHAKWVHLQGKNREALLTGSANLSRSALLQQATDGNIETGVITVAEPGGFASLYDSLRRTPIGNLASLGLSLQPAKSPSTTPDHPVVLWSRLDRNKLTVVFDRPVGALPVALSIMDDVLSWSAIRVDGKVVEFDLDEHSAERVADGGPLTVEVGDGDAEPAYTWPYQVGAIRHRLDKASSREHLHRIANLPTRDDDLFALLQELEATLIFDPASAWRVAKPAAELPAPDEDTEPVRWDDLDWSRVRRDARYAAYLAGGPAAGSPPTDIQVILAAITGRLDEIATTPAPAGRPVPEEEEDDLAHEGETGITADDEDAEDEGELARRSLPTSTRTRMAFNRFVKRYAAATRDSTFIDELGPVVAVTNAAIFNHLLLRLIDRDAVDPTLATDAQVTLWRLLWGSSDHSGLLAQLDPAERAAADKLVVDNGVRETTLRALARSHDLSLEPAAQRAIRDQARHLIVDPDFGLDELLISTTEPRVHLAAALLDLLLEVVCSSTERELNDYVVGPMGLTNADVGWRQDRVRRPTVAGSVDMLTHVLVVHTAVAGLSAAAIHQALERLAVASYLGGWNIDDYLRIRFQGNGRDVGFWDNNEGIAVVLVDEETHESETFDPPLPDWLIQLENLREELAAELTETR